jgi:hypothetical protein
MNVEHHESVSDCSALVATVSEFYEQMSYSVSNSPSGPMLGPLGIDEIMFRSCKSTLESMRLVLEKGHITDAFTLLRRFYDNVLVHIYCSVHLKESARTRQIYDWAHGRDKLPKLKAILTAVSRDDALGELWDILHMDSRYSAIRDRCNDNVHNNYLLYLYFNADYIVTPETVDSSMARFRASLIDLAVLHFASLLSSKYHLMSSSDYVDHLEVGMTPPDDSQYWVAPFVQAYFDNIVKKRRSDVADWMIRNTPMQLK